MSEKGRKLFSTSLDGGDGGENTLFLKYKNEFPSGDPLICACEKNRIEDVESMIQILLETNNNKSRINNEGKTSRGVSFTPLGIAARKGYLNIVQLLIENGVDSSICSKRDKWNVLHIAAYYSKKSSNVVKYLLKHLPEKVINEKDAYGETPLDNAYSNPYRVKDEIVKCMMKYGALDAKKKAVQDAKKKEEEERKREEEERKKAEQDAEDERKRREEERKKKRSEMLRRWKRELDGKRKVNLEKKNLTNEDALAIGEALKTNNTVTELNLGSNNITNLQSIVEALKTNNTLTALYLGGNNITDVQSIVEALKTNNALTRLDLRNNNITDVQSIGEALKTNNTLRRLNLENNDITDGEIQSIIDGLKTNNTLHELDLYNNQLSDNMKSQLKAIKQYKRDGSNGYQQVEGMYIYTDYGN